MIEGVRSPMRRRSTRCRRRGPVFADAGNVWETTSQISLSDLQYGLGFGLRVRLPFVALRLDLGFPTPKREWDKTFRLHFGIGQAF